MSEQVTPHNTGPERASPAPHRTHEVRNQPPVRSEINEYALNTPLVESVERHGASWANAQLTEIGELVGGAEFQRDAELANAVP